MVSHSSLTRLWKSRSSLGNVWSVACRKRKCGGSAGSGSCLLSNAALMADTTSALEWPAITLAIGNIDRAAWRFRVPELRRVKRLRPASFHHTDKPVLSSDSCFIALPSQDQDRRVAGYGIGSGAPRQQNLSIPFHQVLVERRHFRILIRLGRRLRHKE